MESILKPFLPTIQTLSGDLRSLLFSLSMRADFFTHETHYEARSAVEGASTKSDPWIVFVSTPNKPGGFIESFLNEPESKYYKLRLDYTVGLGKIYTEEEIAASQSKTPQRLNENTISSFWDRSALVSARYALMRLLTDIDTTRTLSTLTPYVRSVLTQVGVAARSELRLVNIAITKCESSTQKNTHDQTTTKCLTESTGSTARSNPIRSASTAQQQTLSKVLN